MSIDDLVTPVRRTRPKDRREQILRHAFDLISVSGFNAVSLADVAAASGIQKSSVLHHFPSMAELLLAVLNLRELQDDEFYRQIPGPDQASDAAAARDRFTRVFEHNLERPGLARLHAVLGTEALATDHPAHGYVADRERLAAAEMARSLTWKPRPEIAAAELLAFWNGLELAQLHDPSLDALAVWNSFCDRFFA